MRIQALEAECFRGFGKRRRFEFAGVQVLLLYGPNGHGKTSFFDAIEWGLTGEIHRYQEGTDERKQTRFIGNLSVKGPPCVRLDIVEESGRLVTVTRVGTASEKASSDYGESWLIIDGADGGRIEGAAAEAWLGGQLVREEWREKVEPARGLSLTHLLGQEQMNRLLRGMKGKERYQALSVLLGTDDFARYKELFAQTQRKLQEKGNAVEAMRLESERHLAESLHRAGELQARWEQDGDAAQVMKEVMAQLGTTDSQEVRKRLLARQDRLLEERRQFLTRQREPLRLVRDGLPAWEAAVAVRERERERLARLRQAQDASKGLRDVLWLLDRYDEYANGELKIRELRERAVALTAEAEACERDAVAWKKYRNLIESSELHASHGAGADGRLLETVEEFVRSVADHELRQAISAAVQRIADCVQQLAERKQEWAEAEDELRGWTAERDRLQGLQASLELVLRTAIRLAEQQPDVHACPVCGTEGVDLEHLRAYAAEAEAQGMPETSLLLRSMERAQAVADKCRQQLERAELELAAARRHWETLRRDLHARLQAAQSQVAALHHEARQLSIQCDDLQAMIESYQDQARRHGLAATDLCLDELERLEAALRTHVDACYEHLSEEEQDNLPLALEACQRALAQAEEEAGKLPGRLRELGADPSEAARWSVEDVYRFLRDAETGQAARLAELDAQEQDALRALAACDHLEGETELLHVQSQIRQERAHIEQLQAEGAKIDEALAIVKESLRAIPQAVDALNEQALSKLLGTMQEMFARLNSHPLYRSLEFKRGQRYGANNLTFALENEANPSFIFSAAQINSIALSFFLAMALQQQWSPLRLIAMDDPVQSMDDLNVVAFVDLIRVLCDPSGYGKQFIISTHDKAFHQLMRRKFRFLNVGVIEYDGYGEDGPLLAETENERGILQGVRRIEPRVLPDPGPELFKRRSL